MTLQGKIKPVRWTLVSIFVLLFVLSACSTGGGTADAPAADQPANSVDNSANTEAVTPAENSDTQTEDAAPTEEAPAMEVEAAEGSVSFAADVLPILESRCFQCHGGDKTEGELTLLSYAELMAGGESGAVVIPNDPDNSLLAQLVIDQEMPKRGPKLTPAQTQIIIDWIFEGALDN